MSKNSSNSHSEISPERIRLIREKLQLSQEDAGELIGGGPRAFTKYESGTIKPSAAIINLLQVLDENPKALKIITGKDFTPTKGSGRSPFEVTGKHIESLGKEHLVYLVRRLLAAEAFSNSISSDGIHVAEIITAPDGGEDARICWKDGAERTRYLKCRLNQFQIKSGAMETAKAGNEVLDKRKQSIKPMILSALEEGGTYTLLCAHSYVQKEIKKKEDVIRKTLRGVGLNIKDHQVAFFDSGMIAEWVNTHPSVVMWVLEETKSAIGNFRSWSYWQSSPEHKRIELVDDPRVVKIREKLFPHIFSPDPSKIITPISSIHGVRRIVGSSWIGKSRLVLEALNIKENQYDKAASITDLVLYFDNKGDDSNSVRLAVQNLAESSTRAIIVVDQCSFQMHEQLVNLVRRPESKLSLITIDDDLTKEDAETIVLPVAEKAVIEGMLTKLIPNLPSEDCRRLVKFSQGFSKIAIILGNAWMKGDGIVDTFEKFVEIMLIGQNQVDPNLILRGAQILSVFGVVYDSELQEVSELGLRVSKEDLRLVINELEKRGIVQRRGKAFVVQPRPIALCLAKNRWLEWGEEKWDDIIVGNFSDDLKERAIEQLALLNEEEISIKIAKHLLRRRGPLDSVEKISQSCRAKIFSKLSEIDALEAAIFLERLFKNCSNDDLKKITGDTRHNLVRALDKICFCPNAFERGAEIMLDFAVAENESWANNATGEFKSLFPVRLGSTAADSVTRLAFIKNAIDKAVKINDEPRLLIIIEALNSGAEMNHFSRSVGSEMHGSRPALEPWQPKTWKEWFDYIESFCDHLIDLAKRTDRVGAKAKKILGGKFRSLATRGNLLHVVEKAIHEVTVVHGNYWPEAYERLGDVFEFDRDRLSKEDDEKIQKLITVLQPKTLEDRIRLLITQMPCDYPCEQKMTFDEKAKQQQKDIEDFAKELIESPNDLKKAIKAASVYEEGENSRNRRNTALFAISIANQLKNPIEWLDAIMSGMNKIEPNKRDLNFLSGFLFGVNNKHPDVVENFKNEISKNDFAPALITISALIGIKSTDISRVIDCAKKGSIKPSDIWQWSGGAILRKSLTPNEISPLFDFLFEHDDESFRVGSDLIGMYTHGQREILSKFMPQIKTMIKRAGTTKRNGSNGMSEYCFQGIMEHFLNKGSNDPNAKTVALLLTNQISSLVEVSNEYLIRPLIPKLLSDFYEISWPLIAKTIVSDESTWKFENLLGDKYSFGESQNPAILNLPVDVIFEWCHENSEVAPAFIAAIVPVLTSQNPLNKDITLHPVMKQLLDEFGEREDVLSAIAGNIGTYGWSGSRTTYYKLYEKPFKELEKHPIKQVRFWAQEMIQDLGLQKGAARDHDEEQEARWSVS